MPELDTNFTLRRRCADLIYGRVVSTTITATTVTTDLIDGSDGTYNGDNLVYLEGPCKGIVTRISDYTGAAHLITYGSTSVLPRAGDGFVIHQVIDLTTSTAKLYYRVNGAGKRRERTMTKEDATNGIVTYLFVGDELYAGDLECEVQITLSTGLIYTSKRFTIDVPKRIKDVRENP